MKRICTLILFSMLFECGFGRICQKPPLTYSGLFGLEELNVEFEKFKKENAPQYVSMNEELCRKEIFAQSLEETIKHNQLYEHKKVPFSMGTNQFSDRTRAELEAAQITPEQYHNYTPKQIRDLFHEFMMANGKKYAGPSEQTCRMELFAQNLGERDKKFPDQYGTLGMMNVYSDWGREENWVNIPWVC